MSARNGWRSARRRSVRTATARARGTALQAAVLLAGATAIGLTGAGPGTETASAAAAGSDYPSKPITWVVPFGPGGASDQFARSMAKAVEQVEPDVKIVVVNMPGAQTQAGLTYTLQQPADGYTVFGTTTDVVFNAASGRADMDLSDVRGVSRMQQDVDMWFARADDSRFSDFDSMIVHMQETGEQLAIGTTGLDGSDAFAIDAVGSHFGVTFKNIPYSQPAERYAALLGGTVDLLYEQPGDLRQFIESGTYRPLLAMADERLPGFESLPTSVEVGVDVTTGYWRGALVRNETPDDVVAYLEELFSRAMQTESYRTYEAQAYLDLRPGFLGSEAFDRFMREEYAHFQNAARP